MYRRVVSLLLLPCVLLTQSAAMLGHAHAGMRLPGHDLRPHVHTNAASTRHADDHGHHHHGPGVHHHHNDAEPGPHTAALPESQPDHDSDALYVTAVDAVVAERSQALEDIASSFWWLIAEEVCFASCWDYPPDRSIACGHSPPQSGSPCPLYVRHLALLI